MRQDQNDDCGDIHLAANTSIFGECDLISPADRKHFVFDNMNWFGATKVDRKGEVERPGKKKSKDRSDVHATQHKTLQVTFYSSIE